MPRSNTRSLRRELLSTLSDVDIFCDQAAELLRDAGLRDEEFAVQMLLRESLNNAIVHGNDGLRTKRICVEVRIGKRLIVIRIADEGQGFDWKHAETVMPDADSISGRGLPIYALYATRISFNQKGNQVTFARRINGDKDGSV